MRLNARKMVHPDDNGTTLLLAIEDITNGRRQEQEKDLRLGELRHRVKNLLALVRALARRTGAEGRSGEEYRDAFLGRLEALAVAHELAFEDRTASTWPRSSGASWRPTRPRAAVAVEAGPAVVAGRGEVQALALVLHELATNAVKHGALSVPEGGCGSAGGSKEAGGARRVRLRWEERGGPRVAPPAARGFGTLLIERRGARARRAGGTDLRARGFAGRDHGPARLGRVSRGECGAVCPGPGASAARPAGAGRGGRVPDRHGARAAARAARLARARAGGDGGRGASAPGGRDGRMWRCSTSTCGASW